jgi:hypothetical protein
MPASVGDSLALDDEARGPLSCGLQELRYRPELNWAANQPRIHDDPTSPQTADAHYISWL